MKNPTEMSDEKLMQFYLSNSPASLATLTDLYKDRIYRAIYTIVMDKFAAEEIFKKVFVSVINQLMTGKRPEEGDFLPWAIEIAQQLSLEHNKKAKMVQVDFINLYAEPTEEERARSMYYESHTKIRSMINMLPESQREVLVLNHYVGMSFRDIATRMQCSVTNVLETMKLGLNNLQKLMTDLEVWQ